MAPGMGVGARHPLTRVGGATTYAYGVTEKTTSHLRRAFAERLARAPLLLDGAMGTLLFSRGVPQRSSLDELVESRNRT